MDQIREAFQKVKKEIESLREEVYLLRLNLVETRKRMIEICELIGQVNDKKRESYIPTDKHVIQTDTAYPSTHNLPLEALNRQKEHISTGNQGASTDRQTDRQTDTYEGINALKNKNSIENAVKILSSLDSIKKDIRLKFKRLTEQELLVFSKLYQLDEEVGYSDYKTLSQKLNLTESSIRDYIGRIIKKGIPVVKHKINNKNIQLSISKDLKKIATLSTILQLRDL